MAIFEPTETSKKLQQLAERLLTEKEGEFPARAQMKRLARFLIPPPIKEGETLDIPTGITQMPPVAISLPYATKQIKQLLQKGVKLPPKKLQEIADTLRVLEATPKRALQTVADLNVGGPEMAGGFATHPKTTGHWSFDRIISLRPWGESGRYSMPEALAHEIGHETTERLLQKRGKTLSQTYEFDEGLWEGIAEYLGASLGKKAGIPYTPKFPYGFEQQRIFGKLEEMPSKNPYLNVYKYLKESGVFPKK